MFKQRIVGIERIADLKGFKRQRVDLAFLQIRAHAFRFGVMFQLIIEIRGGGLIDFDETFYVRPVARLAMQCHARAFRQYFERVAKIYVLFFHHERKNIAAHAACAETVPRLRFGKHKKRGRARVRMKRTQPRVRTSRFSQFHRLRNEVNDVEFLFDFVNDRHDAMR
ncbi:MAG: hypothetical protein HDKAJFGB_00190 [Anaerolineae bacterium]|nr:hypothetical protein [Anaerolineae bacterium]